jgi:hypothetical protein
MKTIVDCERVPKPAYFEYKKALSPILLSLRSDRFTVFDDENISIETYVCNDTNTKGEDYTVVYEAYLGGKMIKRAEAKAEFDENTVTYITNAEFNVRVEDREQVTVKAFLIKDGEVVSHNSFEIGVFKRRGIEKHDGLVIIDDLEAGEHTIAGETVTVENKAPSFFASRDTGHPAVAEFREKDFYMMYSQKSDMIEYLVTKDFKATGFTPILLSRGKNSEMMAAGVKEYEGKKYVISLAKLLPENPVMERFISNLYKM